MFYKDNLIQDNRVLIGISLSQEDYGISCMELFTFNLEYMYDGM